MNTVKEKMNEQLDYLVKLSRGSKWSRFVHAPWRYVSGQFFQKIIYPWQKQGKTVRVDTFWGDTMFILLPAAMDIFLVGGKTHDSELRLARFMINFLSSDDRVVDIGAHFGFFSLLASRLVGAGGRVEAFEASGNTFTILQKNVGEIRQVGCYHLAISDSPGQVDFYEFPIQYMEYNTLHPEQFSGQGWFIRHTPLHKKVASITLDEFCIERAFKPTFIKIDVEGAEERVIAGMSRVLNSLHPVIVMEYLSADRHNEEHRRAVQRLEGWGYFPHIIAMDGRLERCDDIDFYLAQSRLDSDNLVFC